MSVQLNHTIVFARDRQESAEFLAGLLGLELGEPWGPFLPLVLANGVTLDFATGPDQFTPQHYAFLISEREFDELFARLQEGGISYWADPRFARPGEINHNDGGRGVYFRDPSGHGMEAITVPYGGF